MVAPPSISSCSPGAVAVTDEATLEALLAPLFLPAYRLAFGMLRNREEAEDAVQEAALSAWRHRQTFRAGADARPWFFAIVANQCRSLRRNRWSRLLRQADPVASSQPTADLDADIDLRRALARLGHDDRLVLVLRYYVDLPYEEIAATLSISDQAARSRTQRAVRRLRAHLDSREVMIP
jgi:RNA polymerase sigma-70 factor (ECF subfamily)